MWEMLSKSMESAKQLVILLLFTFLPNRGCYFRCAIDNQFLRLLCTTTLNSERENQDAWIVRRAGEITIMWCIHLYGLACLCGNGRAARVLNIKEKYVFIN